jgi:hypothetical protein
MPGHSDQHVTIGIDLAVDVDVLAEGALGRGSHAMDQVRASGDGGCQDQRRRGAAMPRRGHADSARRLFALVAVELLIEHCRVRLPEQGGNDGSRIWRVRQATRQVVDRVRVCEAIFDLHVTFGFGGDWCWPPPTDNQATRRQSGCGRGTGRQSRLRRRQRAMRRWCEFRFGHGYGWRDRCRRGWRNSGLCRRSGRLCQGSVFRWISGWCHAHHWRLGPGGALGLVGSAAEDRTRGRRRISSGIPFGCDRWLWHGRSSHATCRRSSTRIRFGLVRMCPGLTSLPRLGANNSGHCRPSPVSESVIAHSDSPRRTTCHA